MARSESRFSRHVSGLVLTSVVASVDFPLAGNPRSSVSFTRNPLREYFETRQIVEDVLFDATHRLNFPVTPITLK